MSDISQPLQSLRASCDRCRFHKLSCAPSSDTESTTTCQRCLRAKVSCVFSRRARKGRQHKRQERIDTMIEISPTSNSCSRPPLERSNTSSSSEVGTTIISSMKPFISGNTGPSRSPVDTVLGDSLLSIYGGSNDMEGGWSFSDFLPAEIGLQDGYTLSREWVSFQEEQRTSEPADGVSHSDSLLSTPEVDFGMSSTLQTEENTLRAPGLSALLVAMHNYSRALQEYQSSNTRAKDGLNDYPIGDLVYLAQWFCSILSCCRPPSLEKGVIRTSNGLRDTMPLDGEDAFDMPTLLLVLTCYITMINIYNTVFSDLQECLLLLPETRLHKAQLDLCWGLRLGELPLMNEMRARTQNAVSMLVDALYFIENLLGLPQKLRSTLLQSVTDETVNGVWALDGPMITLLKQGAIIGGEKEGLKEELSSILRIKIEQVTELLVTLPD